MIGKLFIPTRAQLQQVRDIKDEEFDQGKKLDISRLNIFPNPFVLPKISDEAMKDKKALYCFLE